MCKRARTAGAFPGHCKPRTAYCIITIIILCKVQAGTAGSFPGHLAALIRFERLSLAHPGWLRHWESPGAPTGRRTVRILPPKILWVQYPLGTCAGYLHEIQPCQSLTQMQHSCGRNPTTTTALSWAPQGHAPPSSNMQPGRLNWRARWPIASNGFSYYKRTAGNLVHTSAKAQRTKIRK